MFKIATSVLLLALMVSIAAPATATDKGLGLTTQNNIAAMVVDLTPSYANVKIEGSDGLVADSAITRYRTGRVKQLLPMSSGATLGTVGGASRGNGAQQSDGPR